MLKGAIIGLGNIAMRGHVPAYRTDEQLRARVSIVAVVDVIEQNREKANEVLRGARFYSDIETLLSKEPLDFVDICTPPHTHGEYIRACASRGIHVICEKPLTESYAAVGGLRSVIQDAKIVFVPCHQYKYSPLWKSIHDIIKSGKLGKVTLAQFNVVRLHADSGTAAWNPEWRTDKKHSGGGILVDTGAHYFYLVQYLFGIPKGVSALLRTLKHLEYGVEDTAVVTLEYGGALIQLNLTWAGSTRANSVSIVGTEGALSYTGTALFQTTSAGVEEIPMPNVSDKNQYIGWYASLFQEFVSRIEAKNYSDDLLQEALTVMKLLDVSYRGSTERRILELS